MRTAALVSIVLATAGSALGQNRLDRPLDRNTQVGSGGMNSRTAPDIAAEVRLRNAIVTGNAPGGLSFRGDVGYRAPGEFFGSLGSNETFTFRRDSYYSGLGGMGIRGTDALQYQFAMTTGNTPPPGFAGNPTLSRSGAGTSAATASQGALAGVKAAESSGGITRAQPNPDEPGADLRGLSLLSIRSPSAFVASRGLEPTVMGRMRGADGSVTGVVASGLRGISYDDEIGTGKKDQKSGSEFLRGVDTRIGSTPVNPREDTRADTRADTKLDPNAGAPERSSYDELIDRIKGVTTGKEDPKEKETRVPAWQKELEDLRRQLGSQKPLDQTKPENKPKSDTPGDTKPEDKDETDKDSKDDTTRPQVLDAIRESGKLVPRLVIPGFDAFATHMKAAQDFLAQGQFFYAEERFTAALAVKSGDPMAAIGRVHAQLGAGMFLSAAINLKSLFVEHPEVAALKYGPELMPSPERTRALVGRLGNMADSKDIKRRDSAFLQAYLAFQSSDDKAMKHGLAIMAEPPPPADGKTGASPDQLQKLAAFLTEVWTKPANPKPATPPAEPKAEPKVEPKPEPTK